MFKFCMLLMFFVSVDSFSEILNRVVGVVNQTAITEKELSEFVAKMKNAPSSPLKDVKEKAQKEKALDLLVDEKLMAQAIKKYKLTVSDAQVESQIKTIEQQNSINRSQLEMELLKQGISFETYKVNIKKQLERKRLVEEVIRPNVNISDEQARIYYNTHSKSSDQEVEYNLSHIIFPKKGGGRMPLDRVKKIAKEVNAGNFFAMAQKYSADSSASNGGDLGFIRLSYLDPSFGKAISGLSAGEVTRVIESDAGYHIFLLKKIRYLDDFEQRKDEIKNYLYQQKFEQKIRDWIVKEREQSHIKIFL